jgi:hypothetical protein
MIDPFTLITGVAGLVSLAIQIMQITSDFASSVKDAADSVKDLNRELIALKTVLEQLESFLTT